jgi:hypothetical protein
MKPEYHPLIHNFSSAVWDEAEVHCDELVCVKNKYRHEYNKWGEHAEKCPKCMTFLMEVRMRGHYNPTGKCYHVGPV